MAGRICGARGGMEVYSLGLHLVMNHTLAHWQDIRGISELLVPVLHQLFERNEFADYCRVEAISARDRDRGR